MPCNAEFGASHDSSGCLWGHWRLILIGALLCGVACRKQPRETCPPVLPTQVCCHHGPSILWPYNYCWELWRQLNGTQNLAFLLIFYVKSVWPVLPADEGAARFSPDDKFSKQRIICKRRFKLLPTQQAPHKFWEFLRIVGISHMIQSVKFAHHVKRENLPLFHTLVYVRGLSS